MVEDIVREVRFFFISVGCGILLLAVYDLLRIFRRLVRRGPVLVAVTDLLFWAAGGVFMFTVIYQRNFGIIRSFSLAGMALGMFVYHNTISGWLVEHVVRVVKKALRFLKRLLLVLVRPIRWIFRRCRWFFCFLGKKLMKPLKCVIKGLKKKAKTVKIAVTKK